MTFATFSTSHVRFVLTIRRTAAPRGGLPAIRLLALALVGGTEGRRSRTIRQTGTASLGDHLRRDIGLPPAEAGRHWSDVR